MKRQLRWVSLVSLGAAIAIGAVGCLGEDAEDTSVSIGAVSLGEADIRTDSTANGRAITFRYRQGC